MPNGVTVTSAVPIDVTARSYRGSTYIFSVDAQGTGTSASFNVANTTSGTVTVLDENRTLTLSSGSFTDNFAGYGVHLYKVN